MRKKKFFQNLGNITIFGIFITFVTFFFYSVGTFIVVEYFEIEMTNYYALEHGIDVGENPRPFTMNVMRICVVAALLCSTDVVAAVSIVDYTKQPKLFSVIFGEGIVNDIVCIILFNTIVNLMSEDFTAGTLFTVLVQFILLGVVSLSIGAIFGFFTSWIFKHASFLRVNAITETFLIIAFSYISYFVSDFTVLAGIRMSGIISLLTCGIVQSHYTYYNLSPQGKIISTSTITFIAIAAEAGVYSYIGLSLYSNIASWWSFEFIIYETFIVIGGRYGAIYLCFALFNLCFKSRSISAKELLFIGWGGMIRGAVAFALVMRIPYIGAHNCNLAKADTECFETSDYEMIVTTTISLVIFTTLVFGTFMALLGKIVVPTPTTGTDEH
jgi:sodium/hydrogen exchanger-like protein 6/7/sodium/hydrogen exchanger 8